MGRSATNRTSTDFIVVHPLDSEDAAITVGIRAAANSTKGILRGIDARGPFDALMESVLPRGDVTFEADTLAGVPGLWVHSADSRSDRAILHLHGGWFNFGSAWAYRHLVGHIAARAGARTFIPDYRLACWEAKPYGAAMTLRCEVALIDQGTQYRAGLPRFIASKFGCLTARDLSRNYGPLEQWPRAAR
jgi:epsilon-lactone hydrolase